MYTVETAKLSSKGQMVIPDSLRKRYGWMPGATLMLIGTGDSLVVQSFPMPEESAVEKSLAESRRIADAVSERMAAARDRLAALRKLRISLPVGIEDGDTRMKAILEKHG